GWLDLFDRNRRPVELELEQAAQRGQAAAVIVNQPRVFLEQLVIARAHRVLQLGDAGGIVHVMLATAAPLVLAADLELVIEIGHDLEGAAMAVGGLARDRLEPDTADARRGPGEVAID